MIFNALSNQVHCDHHVGCLSLKTVLQGEEWYGVNSHRLAVRPGQFLILNDDQPYSCHIDHNESVRSLSIFFKKEFAAAVFHDSLQQEDALLDNPAFIGHYIPEFFQTLHTIDLELQKQLAGLVALLNSEEHDQRKVDEYLIFLLLHLIRLHHSTSASVRKINAVKSTTRTEIYKRLCVAKDILQSSYMNKLDIDSISAASCLSVPQLIRQFKSAFHATPHQYLVKIRLQRAAALLKDTAIPVSEVTWRCGYEDASAFGRAFKSAFGVQPGSFRK